MTHQLQDRIILIIAHQEVILQAIQLELREHILQLIIILVQDRILLQHLVIQLQDLILLLHPILHQDLLVVKVEVMVEAAAVEDLAVVVEDVNFII